MTKESKTTNLNNYRSIYVPLDLYLELDRLSKERKIKKCDIIKESLECMSEAINNKIPGYETMKTILLDLIQSYNTVGQRVLELKEEDEKMFEAIYELANVLKSKLL